MAMSSVTSCRALDHAGHCPATFQTSKEQAIVLLVVRQLADAQFVRADRAASERLWQEVADLQLDIERLIHLLYSGLDPCDREALRDEDNAWLARRAVNRPRRWGMANWRPGWARHQPRPAACAS